MCSSADKCCLFDRSLQSCFWFFLHRHYMWPPNEFETSRNRRDVGRKVTEEEAELTGRTPRSLAYLDDSFGQREKSGLCDHVIWKLLFGSGRSVSSHALPHVPVQQTHPMCLAGTHPTCLAGFSRLPCLISHTDDKECVGCEFCGAPASTDVLPTLWTF